MNNTTENKAKISFLETNKKQKKQTKKGTVSFTTFLPLELYEKLLEEKEITGKTLKRLVPDILEEYFNKK